MLAAPDGHLAIIGKGSFYWAKSRGCV